MAKDFNAEQVVNQYDAHIRKLIPGYEVVHQQIQAILKTYLPSHAKVLVVGCGTGYELSYLLELFPNWQFTATDLSSAMLDKARLSVQQMGQEHRVDFVLGELKELNEAANFDAALCILVTHFVPFEHKLVFWSEIYKRLKDQALFLSFDLTALQSDQEALVLKNICESNGLTDLQTSAMLKRLADDFFALSETQTFELLRQVGFQKIDKFTQILCYQGLLAQK